VRLIIMLNQLMCPQIPHVDHAIQPCRRQQMTRGMERGRCDDARALALFGIYTRDVVGMYRDTLWIAYPIL
jgi:hypothetical protein